MNAVLDSRVNAFRSDLADARLEGRVEAERFVEGTDKVVTATAAPIRRAPRPDAPLDTEALYGETARVFEETAEGWAWVQLATDGYVGWMPSEALAKPGPAPTHQVKTLRTLVYPGPDMKLPPAMWLSLESLVAVSGEHGPFAQTPAGFVYARHLAPLGEAAADWVAVAERLVGTTYLWGGRTSLGLDCSALIQLSLAAGGIPCPRDSYMQAAGIGEPIDHTEPARLERGDLLFWPGHVGIALGDGRLLHANAHHMDTVIEPLEEAIARIAGLGLELSGARRLVNPE